jgi:hypothetical protein
MEFRTGLRRGLVPDIIYDTPNGVHLADPNLGEVAASVWDNKIGGKPQDNIFNSRALFYLLSGNGFKESADGGKTFEFTLNYAENTTFKSYGEFDTLDTSRISVFDASSWTPKIHAGTVVYSELETLRASGGSAKFDLIAEKLEVGKNSHIANLNRVLYGDGTGNGSLDMMGLQGIIATAPTTSVVIGGINGSTFPFWRNQQQSGAKTTNAFDNLRSVMRSVYNKCSRGGTADAPTGWITDRATFEGYESLLVANERYNKTSKQIGGDAGFDNDALLFKGAKGLYDEDAVAGNLYFMNPTFLKLVYLKGGWMKMYPEVDPSNQLANVHKVATFGTLCTNNRRRLGVVTAIT